MTDVDKCVPVAIPVRAIPYATAWDLAPLDVAAAIAEPPDWEGRKFWTVLAAHHFDSSGAPRPLLYNESAGWASRVLERAELGAPRESQVAAMPAGVFVWERDLRVLLRELNDIITAPQPYGPGLSAAALNLHPLLAPNEEALVGEGFARTIGIAVRAPNFPGQHDSIDKEEALRAAVEQALSADDGKALALLESAPVKRRRTSAQKDKIICQAIAARLWRENPNLEQADVLRSPDLTRYRRIYKDPKTVRSWISPLDPRPQHRRRGRRPRRDP